MPLRLQETTVHGGSRLEALRRRWTITITIFTTCLSLQHTHKQQAKKQRNKASKHIKIKRNSCNDNRTPETRMATTRQSQLHTSPAPPPHNYITNTNTNTTKQRHYTTGTTTITTATPLARQQRPRKLQQSIAYAELMQSLCFLCAAYAYSNPSSAAGGTWWSRGLLASAFAWELVWGEFSTEFNVARNKREQKQQREDEIKMRSRCKVKHLCKVNICCKH